MSIITDVHTPSCDDHRDCLANVQLGIECHASRNLVSGPPKGRVIAREIEHGVTTFYGEVTYHHDGLIGPMRISDWAVTNGWRAEYANTLVGPPTEEELETALTYNWDREHPKVSRETEILTYESYVGRVVHAYTTRVTPHWDSGWPDYDQHHAIVAEEDGTFADLAVASDAYTVDASDELIAAYWAHSKAEAERVQRELDAAAFRAAEERAEREANTPYKGRRVVVARGRKVPKGTTGEVIWYGEGAYHGPRFRSYRDGGHRGPMRVGIKDAQGTVHWTAASNVDVIQDVAHAAE